MSQLSKIVLSLLVLYGCGSTSQVRKPRYLADLLVKPAELPAGFKLSKKTICQSSGATRLFVGQPPVYFSSKTAQAFENEHGGRWVVYYFEAGFNLATRHRSQLMNFIREGERRSLFQPEELIFFDRFLLVLCNGFASPMRRWYLNHLRDRFAIQPAVSPAVYGPELELAAALYWAGQNKQSYSILNQMGERNVFAEFLKAEITLQRRDFVRAAAGYQKVLQMHGQQDRLAWAAHHGLGLSLASTGRISQALKSFAEANSWAEQQKRTHLQAIGYYDTACAYAELGRVKLALDYLEKSTALDIRFKKMAAADKSLKKLQGNRRFKEITGQGS